MGIKSKDTNKAKQKLIKELEKTRKKVAKLEKEQKNFKKTKAELKAEREKFNSIISSMSDGFDIIDKNYRICFQNKMLKDRFGDLTGKVCFEEYMKRKTPCELCLVQKAIKTKKPQKTELTAPDGKVYQLTSTPFKDVDGKTRVIEIVRDITSLKETDRQIKESGKRFRELFDHMSSGVAVYEAINNGKDFIFKDLNRAGEKIENVKREVILGRSILEVLPGIKEFGLFDVLKKVWKTGKPEIHPISLYKDNRIAGWRENYVYKLPSGEIVTIYDDITKRKQDEEKIEESEKRFRKSIMNAPLPIMIHKENGKVVAINEVWTEITGYTKEEIPTIEAWTKKAFGKKKKLMRDVIDKLYEIDKRVDEGEFEIKTKSGDKRIWHFSSAPLGKSADGGRLVISMALDVTEQKKREEEYKNLIDGMNDTVFVIDFAGNFVEVNETAVEVLGYSREELLSMGPNDIDVNMSPEDIEVLIDRMKMGETGTFETAHKTKSGNIIPVEVSSSVVTYQGKPYILSIARNITERKKITDALRKSEGQLSVIFNSSSDLQILFSSRKDGEFRIARVNETAIATAKRLGFDVSEESFLGQTVKGIVKSFLNTTQRSPEKTLKLFQMAAETGKTVSFEEGYSFGNRHYSAEVTIVPILDEDGKCLHLLWTSHDVTKRKKAEEALRESEEQLSAIFNNTSDLQLLFSLEKDGELRVENVNKTAISTARRLGLDVSKESFLGKTVRNILKYYITPAQKDTEEVYKMFWRTVETGKPTSYEETYTFGNRLYSGEVTVLPVLDKSGKCSHVLWNSHDITDRKKALESLRESEERFQTVIDDLPLGILLHNLDGSIVMVNKASCELGGYTKEELLNLSVADLDPQSVSRDDRKKFWLNLTKGGSKSIESVVNRKDGSKFPAEIHICSIILNGRPMILAAVNDTTKRKETLEKLRESEERFQTILENLPHGAFVHDLDGKIILVNKASSELTGYTKDELLKMAVSDIGRDRKNIWLKLQKKGGFFRGETTFRRKDGTKIPVEIHGSAVSLGENPMIIGIAHDITERKKALEDLRKGEDQLSAVFNNASDMLTLWSADEDGEFRLTRVNQTSIDAAVAFGINFSREANIGKTLVETSFPFTGISKDFYNNAAKHFQKTAKTGKPAFFEEEISFLNRTFYSENTTIPVLDERGKCLYILWTIHDITKQKQILKALQESEEQLSVIFNNASDPLLLLSVDEDRDFRIVRVNETAIDTARNLGLVISNESFTDKTLREGLVDVVGLPEEVSNNAFNCIQETIKTGKSGFYEETFNLGNEKFYYEVTTVPVLDQEGNCLYILLTPHDVTKTKRTLEALQKSEERFETVIENLPDEIFVHGLEGKFIMVNKASCEKTGYTKEELLGMKVEVIDHESVSRDDRKNIWLKLQEKGGFERIETTHYRKDGSSYPAEIYFGTVTYKGSPMIIGIAHDITDRKKALEKLKESEERFQIVIENLPHGVCLHDLNGKMTLVNKALCKLTGYSEKEMLNMKVQEVDHECATRDDRHNLWLKLNKGGHGYVESTLYRKNGSTFPGVIYLNAINLKEKPMILAITQDITERKKAIEKLKESEERFQTIIENLPHAVSLSDLDGNFVLVNEALCKHTGYTRDEFMKMKVGDVDRLSPTRDDRKKIWLKLNKGGHTHFESELSCKDGSTYPVEIHINAITLEGEPMILAIAQDISDMKKALEGLQKSEEKYRNLYDSMIEAFARIDMEGNIIEFNKQYLDMLEYNEGEIKNLKYTDLTPEKWHEMEEKIIEEQVIKRGYSDVYEKEYIKKDGTVFPVELRTFLLRDGDGNPQGMWAIVRDITERKRTGEELRKIERLESLGVLAGGIAHDFNNLLTGILGNLSIVQMAEGEDLQNILEEAKQAAIQAKNLTQQLLTFSKGGEPIKGKVAIEDLIRESAEFSLHGSNVRCQYGFAKDLWKVEVDKGQISQVIDNLVINSNQAMPEGGKIHIKAENIILPKDNLFKLPEGKYIKITLKDEGIGMPEEFLPKIFDPYFSTKQEGSGLGLATVFSIIQRHDGYITVESEVGEGTTFFIYIPAIKEKTSKKKKEEESKETLMGEGKILIMDDEKIVRRAVGGMLRRLGYTVESAVNGEEALVKYKEAKNAGKPFDAVILDLTVPGGMGGKKTIEKLLQIDPDVKAVVSSGYSTDPVMANHKKHGFKAVVAKPFDLTELNKAIKKALK